MSSCNYCLIQDWKCKAKQDHSKIMLRQSLFMGGTDVFIVPKGEKLASPEDMIGPCDEYPDGNEAYSKYYVAWMMEIPDHCCC